MTVVLEDVRFSYFEKDVLRDVNIALERGLVHVILGRTGSGKTTLALILAGLLKPADGSVRIDGSDPAADDFDRSRVQLAFQFPESQIFELSVEKELEYGLTNFGLSPEEIKKRRDWALDCVGLADAMLVRDPGSLSFGERRKVALASIIALRPDYLILDEPLAGLDWHGRRNLISTVARLKDEGLSSIILTHEADVVGEIGDTVSVAAEKTVRGPLDVAEFLDPESEPEHGLLPEYLQAFRSIRCAGLPLAGAPRSPEAAARAVADVLKDGSKDRGHT
jgi:energy-coupling factor transporter ATP-binding protein EcfA2